MADDVAKGDGARGGDDADPFDALEAATVPAAPPVPHPPGVSGTWTAAGPLHAPPGAPAGNGAFRVWPLDAQLRPLGSPAEPPRPNQPEAVDIYFGIVDPSKETPTNQAALQADIDKTLRVVRHLYLETNPQRPERFRIYYVRLFTLAQLGLEDHASPDAARAALQACVDELIDDEAVRVKNGHLQSLGRQALWFAAPFMVAYLLLSMLGDVATVVGFFDRLGASIGWLRCFALLWIGCFLGVWLSYGIRTTKFTLSDLMATEQDRLQPAMRLLFAGVLTMVLGILLAMGVVELRIGDYALTRIATSPMLAFLVGTFCGISELTLPSSISKRAAGWFGKAD